nr:P4 protein [Carrot reovirus 1]
MNPQSTKQLLDTRALQDPHPNQLATLLSNPITYAYKFNRVTGAHSLKLSGVWSGFYPSALDLNSELFSTLKESTEEIKDEELSRLLKELQLSISLPVDVSIASNYPGTKYCYMLAWMARAYQYSGKVWGEFRKNPSNFHYDMNYGINPLDRYMQLCDENNSYSDTFGLRSYMLPGEKSPDLATYTSISDSFHKKSVAWIRRLDFERNFCSTHIIPDTLCAIHQTWTYDTPHFVFFHSRVGLADYLIAKIKENRACFQEYYDGLGGQIDRVSEAVATFMESDPKIIELTLIQNDQSLTEEFISSNGHKTGKEFLMTPSQIDPMIWIRKAKSCRMISITRQMGSTLIASQRPFWPHTSSAREENLEDHLGMLNNIGEGTAVEDAVKWSELPLGDEITEACDLSSVSVISSLLHSVSVIPDDRSIIHLEIGRGIVQQPSLEARQVSEEEREIALQIFSAELSDELWQIRQTGRITGLTGQAVRGLREKLKKGELSRVEVFSVLHLLQNLLFNDCDQIVSEYVAKPSLRARIERINNSSLKLLSVFVFFCRAILRLGDSYDLSAQTQVLNISKIVIAGTIDDPFAKCLRRTYPNIKIVGFGADAVAPNIRMSIEGSGFKNMSCSLLFSDVDQSQYKNFDEMVEATCEYVIAFVSWAAAGAIKINNPSAYLFNAIQERLDAMNQRVFIFPFQVSYQNVFSPECFLMFHATNSFRNGLDRKYYAWNDNIFQSKARWLALARRDFKQAGSMCLNRLLTKRQLSIDHAPSCGYFSLVVPLQNAKIYLSLLLEVCNEVTTWKTKPGEDMVNMYGRISKPRLALTQRVYPSINMRSTGARFVSKSFGATSKRLVFSSMISVPWFTVIAEAARLMMVHITEEIFNQRIDKFCAIGSRNLTESYSLRKYDVRCFDEYYANGPEIRDIYGINYVQRVYQYGEEEIIDNEGIMANFVLMSSLQPDNSVDNAEARDQYDKIRNMVRALRYRNTIDTCFMCSLYLNALTDEMDRGSEFLPLGIKFSAPDRMTFGDYLPVSTITLNQLAEVLREECDYVRYAMLSYDWVLKACNIHGWVPSVAGAPGLALSEKIIVLLFISPMFVEHPNENFYETSPLPRVNPEPLATTNAVSQSQPRTKRSSSPQDQSVGLGRDITTTYASIASSHLAKDQSGLIRTDGRSTSHPTSGSAVSSFHLKRGKEPASTPTSASVASPKVSPSFSRKKRSDPEVPHSSITFRESANSRPK